MSEEIVFKFANAKEISAIKKNNLQVKTVLEGSGLVDDVFVAKKSGKVIGGVVFIGNYMLRVSTDPEYRNNPNGLGGKLFDKAVLAQFDKHPEINHIFLHSEADEKSKQKSLDQWLERRGLTREKADRFSITRERAHELERKRINQRFPITKKYRITSISKKRKLPSVPKPQRKRVR